ncbi:MAG: ATP-NAD kinase family protein, partial [Pseudomonadales bacterium]|nr:ATP-NAD kinase family protein [Pseudomonadales bacterium]
MSRTQRKLKVGLLLNPMAGLGGPAALKGSDDKQLVAEAMALGYTSHVGDRVFTALNGLAERLQGLEVLTAPGSMGETVCERLQQSVPAFSFQVTGNVQSPTSADDTRRMARLLQSEGVDLLLFAGGDGTARDIVDVAEVGQVVLGIPCGVKMHSGVFANNPESVTRILKEMIDGELVTVMEGEVRDIDEASFREGVVRTRHYGEMWVPEELRYIQQVKAGGKEVEALVVDEIAAWVIENMEDDETWFIGSGSTPAAIMAQLGLPNTLLGVDVIRGRKLVQPDAREDQLFSIAQAEPCRMLITVIGGQGHIFGRGNQQFSSRVIQAVGADRIQVIATKSKLAALPGKRLLVDTGDQALDEQLAGFMRVTTGFDDSVLCPVQ